MPITTLEQNFLPPLIVANIINKLSKGDYMHNHIWSSFGPDIILYALLTFAGSIIFWRAVDTLVWKLEANVQRDIARRVFNPLANPKRQLPC
ncbi:MAG: hypothetical protein WDN66_00125 [Candidatus Saccharibacteria bacterium]